MPKVRKNEANIKKCSCSNCPSYNNCSKEKKEVLFCAQEIGKSVCDYKMNGCVCGKCLVHQKNDLKAGYYCIFGSAEKTDN